MAGLTACDSFRFDLPMRLEEAKVCRDAIVHYGEDERWSDLERWGSHLFAIAASPPCTRDVAICTQCADAAISIAVFYGRAERWDDLERWVQCLSSLPYSESVDSDPIRQKEAFAAVNAIIVYGEAQRWNDLERWAHASTLLLN